MFRVIIVGAGPVGLYMAHAMQRANVECVLLEQQASILNFSGQLIFTWPQTVRLFDQIGISREVGKSAFAIHQKKRVSGHDGDVTSTNQFWDFMEGHHGYPFMPLLRSELIKVLYNNLDQTKVTVKTSAELVEVTTHGNGVRVELKDGTVVEGSILIGADGVHSATRKAMQKLAFNTDLKGSFDDPMVSNFYGIFGRASNIGLGIEPETFYESRGSGSVIQCLASKTVVQFVALKPTPEPMSGRRRYTREEEEEYAASLGDVAVCPGIKFKDIWEKADRATTRLLNQEEGVMQRWYYDRVVLIGDAVHKSTSVNGLGMTCGLHSAAALANRLQDLATAENDPGTESIQRVFESYQKDRQPEIKTIWGAGYNMIREVTKDSWLNWFWDRFILPWFDTEQLFQGRIASYLLIRHGQILSYVPFSGKEGLVSWVHQPRV